MEIGPVTLLEKKGGKSDIKVTGKGLTAAVLVMSDSVSGGRKKDVSGKILVERLKRHQFSIALYKVLPDDRRLLEEKLIHLADKQRVNLIVTTGGTGMSPRDVSPEATLAVITRRIEGVEEALRSFGQDRLPMAMLSRGVAGIRGKTIMINLPGSPGGVKDGMDALFPAIVHVFRMMLGEGH